MLFLKKPILLVICVFNLTLITAQKPEAETKFQLEKVVQFTTETYGINQDLVCGEVYENLYPNAIGHPFLFENEFITGNFIFKHKQYKNFPLKYDIAEQRVIINYNTNNSDIKYYLPNEFLNEFEIYNKKFQKLSIRNKPERFYQVIEASDSLKFYFTYDKEKTFSDHMGTTVSYKFSSSKRKGYLMINGDIYNFHGKASIVKRFPKQIQKQLNKEIKNSHIQVQIAKDNELLKLLEICNNLL